MSGRRLDTPCERWWCASAVLRSARAGCFDLDRRHAAPGAAFGFSGREAHARGDRCRTVLGGGRAPARRNDSLASF